MTWLRYGSFGMAALLTLAACETRTSPPDQVDSRRVAGPLVSMVDTRGSGELVPIVDRGIAALNEGQYSCRTQGGPLADGTVVEERFVDIRIGETPYTIEILRRDGVVLRSAVRQNTAEGPRLRSVETDERPFAGPDTLLRPLLTRAIEVSCPD